MAHGSMMSKQGTWIHMGPSFWRKSAAWLQDWEAAYIVSPPHHWIPIQRVWSWYPRGSHSTILGQCNSWWRDICQSWFEKPYTVGLLWRCSSTDHKGSHREIDMLLLQHRYFSTEIDTVFKVPLMVLWHLTALQKSDGKYHIAVAGLVLQCPVWGNISCCPTRKQTTGGSWEETCWPMVDPQKTSIPSCRTSWRLGIP